MIPSRSDRSAGRWVPERDDFLVFGSPLIEDADIAEVVATLKSGWLGTGPRVAQFEEAFRQHTGAKHAVALNSCTAALHIALLTSGVGPGDEVITTPLTFAATANAIVHVGATPVFADIDADTMNISPEAVERAVTPRTRAILPVHFAGRPCDMRALLEIAQRHGLMVVEDCAHAVESVYHGRRCGTFGSVGCFSFYVTKSIATGEGGMLVTDSDLVADRAKTLSLHGLSRDAWKRFADDGYRHYSVIDAGYKYNMMDIQAALGIHQLTRVERTHARRRDIWQRYTRELSDLPCRTPLAPEVGTTHAYHLYTLILDTDSSLLTRDDVLAGMTAMNIGVGVHYSALHTQPFYRDRLALEPSDFPNAHYVSERTISIPLSARLTDDDVGDVVTAVRRVLGRNSREGRPV